VRACTTRTDADARCLHELSLAAYTSHSHLIRVAHRHASTSRTADHEDDRACLTGVDPAHGSLGSRSAPRAARRTPVSLPRQHSTCGVPGSCPRALGFGVSWPLGAAWQPCPVVNGRTLDVAHFVADSGGAAAFRLEKRPGTRRNTDPNSPRRAARSLLKRPHGKQDWMDGRARVKPNAKRRAKEARQGSA
jgi:hypothetical protein